MKAFKEMVTGERSREGGRQYEESQDPSQSGYDQSMGSQQPETGSYYAPPSSARTHQAYGGQQQYGAGQEMERGSGEYYNPRGSQGTYQGQHPHGHEGMSYGRHGGAQAGYGAGEEYGEGQQYGRQGGYGERRKVRDIAISRVNVNVT